MLEKAKRQLIKSSHSIAYLFLTTDTLKVARWNSKDLLEGGWYNYGFLTFPDRIHLNVAQDHIYFDIIRQINKILKEKYNAKLYMIVWDYDMHAQFLDKYDEIVQTTLKNDGIPFYMMSEIIGDDYKEDLERVKNGDFEHFKYRISRWDTHPNALANEKSRSLLPHKLKMV